MEDRLGTGISIWNDGWHEGRFYCRCGATLEVDASPYVVAEVKRMFWRVHDGPGHGMCAKYQAERNRALDEQELL